MELIMSLLVEGARMKRVAEDDQSGDYADKRARHVGEFSEEARMKRVAENAFGPNPDAESTHVDKRVRYVGEFNPNGVESVPQPQPNYCAILAQRFYGHCGTNDFLLIGSWGY